MSHTNSNGSGPSTGPARPERRCHVPISGAVEGKRRGHRRVRTSGGVEVGRRAAEATVETSGGYSDSACCWVSLW